MEQSGHVVGADVDVDADGVEIASVEPVLSVAFL